ncbi:HD domain-containing protein [Candidatus Falkowbacteria bacterium]|nr:HD domain-containing protein [Candidatus Falkowbacteria bacterium]
MSKREIINKIEEEARKYFIGASGCHDWTHVDRVRKLALSIGKKEKADLFILEVAALLHDIGRKTEMESKGLFCHAEKSAEAAGKLLKKYKFPQDVADNIVHSVLAHRYRNQHVPTTLEAKILFDADKLDSIGAIGVARDFLFAGNAGSNNLYTGNEKVAAKSGKDLSYTGEDSAILEYEIKLKFLKNKMLTKTGKAMALDRHNYMADFFKRFWQEVKAIK